MLKNYFSPNSTGNGAQLPHRRGPGFLLIVTIGALVSSQFIRAFPPAPPHAIYGIVRDQIGHPLSDGAEVILEAASGTKVRSFVIARTDSPVNYRVEVPMDAGLTSDLYSPTALMPAAPFRIRVRIGQALFSPMEMTGDLSRLGAPGGSTRIDLTLGVDADGNGLPDAWEKAVADFLGRIWRSGEINPDDVYPGTGLTYRQVYLAGTYAMSPTDGFALQIIRAPGAAPALAFTAVKGRHYTIEIAGDLREGWKAAPFRLAGPDGELQNSYVATQTRRVEVVAPLSNDTLARFYRLIVE